MRFFHLSDLHIGKLLYRYSLIEEQRDVLNQIIEKMEEYRPDAVVIAGDIYDKTVPSGEAYQLFDTFLTRLSEIRPQIPVMIIAGNHDHADRLQFASSFLAKHQIYIAVMPPKEEKEGLQALTLTDEHGEVTFYLLPFTKPGYVRHLFPEGKITDYDSAVRGLIEREHIDVTKRNVLVAHQFFVNQGKKPELCDSEYGVHTLGGIDSVDISAVSEFDYVALGHIHGGQTFDGGQIRYCGTPYKYSVSEQFHKKSITMVTMGEKGDLPVIEQLPLNPLRDVKKIKGTLEELLEAGKRNPVTDYVSIVLTDEKELFRPKDSLEEVYDHILEITVDNSRTRAIQEHLWQDQEEHMQTPLESFREFYQMMQQQPLSMEEESVITGLLEELGGDAL